jgi:hypothetical protein
MFLFTGLGNRAGVSTHCALTKKTANIVAYGDGILVKRMTSREEPRRLVACRIPAALANAERGYFVENHVNIIRARTSGLDLDAILGLLNSRLFDYVFRALNGNTNVSSSELELLPVASGPEVAEIAELARALTAVGGEDARLLGALDAAVYRLYAIPAADISELEAQSN